MQVHLVHVGMPQGGVAIRKRKHFGFNWSKFPGLKKCVIRSGNKDSLCLARALVTDMVPQEKHHTGTQFVWDVRLSKSSPKSCTRRLLSQRVSAHYLKAPSPRQSSKTTKSQIIVLFSKQFNAISSMPLAFLGESYWCLECKRGYNEKEQPIDVSECVNAVSQRGVME